MRLAVVGVGRMGMEVVELAREEGHTVVATLGRHDPPTAEALDGAEVAVEFTLPEAAPGVLEALAATGIPVVTGTTGWYDELPRVREAVEAGGSALLYAPNFSLGVALFRRWVERAARELEGLPDHDVAVMETHHAGKVDAPSGTARLLADTIVDATDRKDRWVLFPGGEDRASGAPLDPGVLRVSASRVGSVPGTHEVVLDGPDDQILLRHTARSRRGFARGALAAAEWIQGRQGLFTLDDMLRDRLGADSGTAARAGR